MTMCRVSLLEPCWFNRRFSRNFEEKGLLLLKAGAEVGVGVADMVNYRFRWNLLGKYLRRVGRRPTLQQIRAV